MNIDWLSVSAAQPQLSQAEAIQLADDGSLTRRIRTACSGRFEVKVIDQEVIQPDEDERALLGLHEPDTALCRRVFLCCDDSPRIFAKTVIGRTDKNEALIERVSGLGTKSLGSILFKDPLAQKRMTHLARVGVDHSFFSGIKMINTFDQEELWVRRTLYDYEQGELMVYEAFYYLEGTQAFSKEDKA